MDKLGSVATPVTAKVSPATGARAATVQRLGAGFGLSVLGGFGLIAAFPPIGAWPLIFVSFVPIALAQHWVLPAAWAGAAPVIGIGTYVGYLAWGGLQPDQRFWLLLLLPLLGVSGWLDSRWQRATRFRCLWWSSPVLWTGALFALGLTPIASWLDPGYALYRQPWLIQPVSIVALSGLNLVIMLTNYTIAGIVMLPLRRTKLILVVSGVALLAGWIAGSAALLETGRSGRVVRVAVVQPGIQTRAPSTPAAARRWTNVLLTQLETSTRQAAAEGARLVLWPEKALTYFDPTIDDTQALRQLVASTGVYLVIGYTPDPRRLNQATVLEPSGQFLGVYNKQHPVGFQGDHSIGGPVIVMNTALGPIAPIICYDLDFENTARTAARKGAQLLAVPSEDWSGIAYQHYTHLVFRAVENRLAAVKADTAWDSAIIDPEGHILASRVTTDGATAVLIATVPLGSGQSPFVTTGDWLGSTCIALSGLWVAIGSRRTTR